MAEPVVSLSSYSFLSAGNVLRAHPIKALLVVFRCSLRLMQPQPADQPGNSGHSTECPTTATLKPLQILIVLIEPRLDGYVA